MCQGECPEPGCGVGSANGKEMGQALGGGTGPGAGPSYPGCPPSLAGTSPSVSCSQPPGLRCLPREATPICWGAHSSEGSHAVAPTLFACGPRGGLGLSCSSPVGPVILVPSGRPRSTGHRSCGALSRQPPAALPASSHEEFGWEAGSEGLPPIPPPLDIYPAQKARARRQTYSHGAAQLCVRGCGLAAIWGAVNPAGRGSPGCL